MEIDGKQNTGESSPSVAVVETQPTGIAVEDLNSEQRKEWLSSGKLPTQVAKKEEESLPPAKEEKPDDKEESSPSKEPEKVEIAEKEKVVEPAPAAKPQEKVEIPPHEARIKQLLADNKILKQRLEKLEQPPEKPAETIENKAPQPEDFETQAEYLAKKVEFEVEQAVKKDRETRNAEELRIKIEAKNQEILTKWNERVTEAQKKYKDFNDKVFGETFNVVEGSVLDRWCLESDLGTDVLYHYATHPDEFARLNQMVPVAAAREIARLEVGILEKPKPAAKLVSGAPKPVTEVSGRGTATDDPIAEALASGDMEKYIRLSNEKERAQLSRK